MLRTFSGSGARPGARPGAGPGVRRVVAAAVGMLLVSGVVPPPASASDPTCALDGDGTAVAPYEIGEASDLASVATGGCDDDAHYRLTGPIDLAAAGAYDQAVVAGTFKGVFDGGGFTISGMSIETSAAGRVGFFAHVDGGTVRNVIFDAPRIDVSVDQVGVVVGRLVSGTVQDVTVRDPQVKGGNEVGGVIGMARHAVAVSAVRVIGGEVTGAFRVGGVVGELYARAAAGDIEATFRDVESSADVEGSESNVGGIAGLLAVDATAGTCSAGPAQNAVLVLENVHVRGVAIVGNINSSSSSSRSTTGGLVGRIETQANCDGTRATTRILDSTVSADVTGRSQTAGLVGQLATSAGAPMNIEIARVRFDGTVTASGSASAGLVGELASGAGVDATIEDATVVGSISGTSDRGGIIGKAGLKSKGEGSLVIRRAAVSGTVTGTGSGVGGIAGYPEGVVTIEQSVFSGTVESTSSNVGGIAGEQRLGAVVRDVIVRGRVQGSGGTGGIAGDLNSGSDTTGNLSTVERAVGIVEVVDTAAKTGLAFGEVSATETTVSHVRVATDVAGSTTADLVGNGSDGGVTGNTQAELRLLATYVDWPMVQGWAPADPDPDEGRVWGICPQVNDGFPFLLWQHTSDPCVDPVVTPAGPSLTCAPAPSVGTEVTCVVTGGPPDAAILWQASYNPVFAGEGVMLDGDGTGTFSFTVPAEALGEEVRVELVEWTAPVSLGSAGGPVPTSVPSGGGPMRPWGLLPLLAAGLLVAGATGRRMVVTG